MRHIFSCFAIILNQFEMNCWELSVATCALNWEHWEIAHVCFPPGSPLLLVLSSLLSGSSLFLLQSLLLLTGLICRRTTHGSLMEINDDADPPAGGSIVLLLSTLCIFFSCILQSVASQSFICFRLHWENNLYQWSVSDVTCNYNFIFVGFCRALLPNKANRTPQSID